MHFDKGMLSCIHSHDNAEYFTALKILCALPLHPSTVSPSSLHHCSFCHYYSSALPRIGSGIFGVTIVTSHLITFCTSQIVPFFLIEGLWQSCVQQVYWATFSNSIYSFYTSAFAFCNSHNISNVFIIIVFVVIICDQRSFDVAAVAVRQEPKATPIYMLCVFICPLSTCSPISQPLNLLSLKTQQHWNLASEQSYNGL